MAEALGSILVFASMVTGFVSFIALFKPLPRVWLPNRKRAAMVCAVSFSVLALLPVPRAGEIERAAQAQQERAQAAELAAQRFPDAQETIEQRLGHIEGLVANQKWSDAFSYGDTLQRELLPLFRSSIAETPEVASIRARNALRRHAALR